MLRKILFFSWMLCQSVISFAFSAVDFPSNFLIQEQGKGQMIDLTANDQKIGSLIPKSSNKNNGIYYFYDDTMHRKITLRFTGYTGLFKTNLHMDVFDDKQILIAKIIYNTSPSHTHVNTFVIYEPDGKTKLLTITSNPPGNIQTVYYKNTWDVVATLHRKLFTWSLDTEVKVINSYQILTNMNPNVFVAALAFYSHTYVDEMNFEPINQEMQALLEAQLQRWAQGSNLVTDTPNIPVSVSQHVVETLNERYKERYDDTDLNEDEKMIRYVGFALDLLQMGVFSNEEEQALYQFLMQRLKQH